MSESVQSGSVFFGRSEGAQLGYAISIAGDIDGDGFADLIFGAPNASTRDAAGSLVSILAGEAVLVRGGPGGFAPVTRLALAADDTRVTVFEGSQSFARTGSAVAGGGDIDGDGLDDLLIGAPFRDGPTGSDAGAAFAVFGGDAALGGWRSGAPGAGSVSQEMPGASVRSYAGFSVAMVGDIDGDGFVDSAVGSPGASFGTRFGAGAVELRFSGQGDRDLDMTQSTDGLLTIIGGAALDFAGTAISSAGDFNGDGIGDLLIGAPTATGGALQSGAAYIVFGRAGGWQADLDLGALAPGAGVVLRGAATGDLAGVSVAAAGDVNGDGIGDVIVGAAEAAGGRGSAFVVYGGRDGLPAAVDLGALDAVAGFRIDGATDGADLGTSVAGVGDVNGDGFDDILVGSPRAAGPGGLAPGAAMLVFGSAGGPGPGLTPDTLVAGQGYVFLGARSFDSAGITVAAAGDMNGDGWSDLLIGADLANDGDHVDAGAVYLVHGGPGILAALDALDGSTDARILLAHVGASVTVETGLLQAPEGRSAPAPDTEFDNDPAVTPEIRGPHDMVSTGRIGLVGTRPDTAAKPRADPAQPPAGDGRDQDVPHPDAGPAMQPGSGAPRAPRDAGTGGGGDGAIAGTPPERWIDAGSDRFLFRDADRARGADDPWEDRAWSAIGIGHAPVRPQIDSPRDAGGLSLDPDGGADAALDATWAWDDPFSFFSA